MQVHEKKYESRQEYIQKFQTFSDNHKLVEELNRHNL